MTTPGTLLTAVASPIVPSRFKLAALYHFVRVDDTLLTQKWLEDVTKRYKIQGTLILANEGLNGTIAGTPNDIEECIKTLRQDSRFSNIEVKFSDFDSHPFVRMNVKIKSEIVTLGVHDGTVDPTALVGDYVDPEHWNDVILDPEVTVIDCRNDYEYDIGTFERAINPKTKTFKEFPKWVNDNLDPGVHKRVAMFCTGGIRCEKASSFMLAQGYEKVYHLKGGILKYLEEFGEPQIKTQTLTHQVLAHQGELPAPSLASVESTAVPPTPAESGSSDPVEASVVYTRKSIPSTWNGQCFVFDDRVSVGHALQPGGYKACRGCRYPCTLEERQLPPELYTEGVYCPHCVNVLTLEQKSANAERHRQMCLAEKSGRVHLGRAT